MQPSASVLGWDIGGAHVKVALSDTGESVVDVCQLSCPLWLGLEQLQTAIFTARQRFDFSRSLHAVTMTGEMVDHFSSRKEGVVRLVEKMRDGLQDGRVNYFAGNKGFVSSEEAVHAHGDIASANWLASAGFVATKIRDALFVDTGSTTTDVVRINNHEVIFDGRSDAERLYARELVYCGVTRTPIFALCKAAPVKGKFIPVINEYFSDVADVYRITGELPKYADVGKTSDGRGKDVAGSVARLARMFGCDAARGESATWQGVAEYIRAQHVQMITAACRTQLSRLTQPSRVPVVGAGTGRFLIKEVARHLDLQYVDFESLLNCKTTDNDITPGDCAPAASVACLAYQRFYA